MNTIKVNPDEMLANIKKIDKTVTSYEKHCKELTELLTSNEAQIDDATQASLVNSINKISQRFGNMSRILRERNKMMQAVAESYRSIDNGNGAIVGAATAALGTAMNVINQIGTGGHF